MLIRPIWDWNPVNSFALLTLKSYVNQTNLGLKWNHLFKYDIW